MHMRSGKKHSSGHAKQGLDQLLEGLGTRGPSLVRGDQGQQLLALAFDATQDDAQLWEYAVLVTDVACELSPVGQVSAGNTCTAASCFRRTIT